MEKILVTGGCGFVGSKLIPSLLKKQFKIKVIDNQWFGNYLSPHKNLTVLKKDTRDIDFEDIEDVSRIIHLANIANDPAVDLDPTLSWEVNVLATQQLLDKVQKLRNFKQFIFASSGSVYGVKTEKDVTEDLNLVPISTYNKTKMIAERVVNSYSNIIRCYNIRPATVCGLSPRMRLDVAVNLLTFQALSKGKVTVLGGNQTRPNIHINDMVRVYEHFLDNVDIIEPGDYNAGFENISIMQIAEIIKQYIPCKIEKVSSNDPRSYRQNSNKLLETGFQQNFTVLDAIKDISSSFAKGKLKDCENFHTIKIMKRILQD